jgi:hypothetical protein
MMRKASGTPFKLKGGAPFKNDELPEGVTTSSEDLGQMANDENHLVNVTKNTMTTPDYSGSEGEVTGQMPGKKMSDEEWTKYLAGESAERKAERLQQQQDAGVRKGYKPATKGKEEVTYETEDIPTPGKPGKTMNSFTAAEGRNLGTLTRQRANAAVRDSRKLKNAEDGTFLGRLFNKETREKGKEAKKRHQERKIEIRRKEAEAGAKQSENANKQASQGVNTFRSNKQVEDGTGTEGTSFTIAPDGTKRLSDLTGKLLTGKGEKGNEFSGMKERLEKLKDFKLNGFNGPITINPSSIRYGRSKTATPFKLNKYKK